ncbi:aminoadipate aminotransferase, isoform CRA_b [Rattus norvegicus]|uniref:Aminoadipate aminotransferase, isoform CRA_b n=1 Tax=Rattus norvegicus TaxID=10116 RepID=A6KIT6_RAT|nr:aminoadipate aminotransferase, isoform CRA_b [Rattus norvegicus]
MKVLADNSRIWRCVSLVHTMSISVTPDGVLPRESCCQTYYLLNHPSFRSSRDWPNS